MIKWLQRQSAAVRVCFAFGYCAIYYGLHFLSGVFSLDTFTTVLLTVFPFFYGAVAQLLFDPLFAKPSRQTFQLMVLPVVLLCVVLLFLQFETLIYIAVLLPVFMALGWFGQWVMRVVLVGDVRKLRWTGGIVFEEHLTALESNTSMMWDFVFNAPEALTAFYPHIAPQGGIGNMQSGSYHLRLLPNDVTLLTSETNYSIRTPVNTYLAIWGRVFLQDFRHAVLSVIKTRSEKG
jgi:hypothetical protein